jgi:hypothetical protein
VSSVFSPHPASAHAATAVSATTGRPMVAS